MQQVAHPAADEHAGSGNLVDALAAAARTNPRAVALQYRRHGRRELLTLAQLHDEVRTIAKGIAASGVQPGDRVGLMATGSPSWILADLAIWYAGAVSVPLEPAAAAPQAEWALSESGAVALFVDGAAQQPVIDAIAALVPNVRRVWRLTEAGIDDLAALGTIVGDDDLERRRRSVGSATPATILYGPAGEAEPRGAVLTHGGLQYAAEAAASMLSALFDQHDDAVLLQAIEPANATGRVLQLACLDAGVRLGYGEPDQELVDLLADLQPDALVAEPLAVEDLLAEAAERERADGRARVFDAAAQAAVAYSEALDTSGPGRTLRARRALFDRTVYPRLRSLLGGRLTHVLFGVPAVDAEFRHTLCHTLRGAGVTVLHTFGAPETSGLTTGWQVHGGPPDAVGGPLAGMELRVADDGEVLVRGPQVFAGYFLDERASREAFTDRWLHLGDTGMLDDEGVLRLTGRLDDRIVTSAGETIAVSALERQLAASPLVADCVVVGNGRPYPGALVQLDSAGLGAWGRAHRREQSADGPAAAADPDLLAAIGHRIDQINADLAPAQRIARFSVVPPELPDADARDIRAPLEQRYPEAVDQLYP